MSDTTDIEKKSLEAHVELCAQRYRLIEEKLETLEEKLTSVETAVTSVKDCVQKMSDRSQDRLLNWGIGIIGFLLATVGWLIQQHFFR